ncbi:MSCRAMM family protein [Enterococcus termitis]|uniref:SpaA-like prealbumin fold domain-containing protein n=1 Tax=Enterococcus termitis TaxID=332950 RepID=A0A1E5GJG6_9ENTE|nr:SpaA isopeptide-forming pilin-related protein [Enterococcus termitis]OEG12838.1 hypothetical protein BCR25_04910 [Enterococcus termitis]OJG96511.1 hypothetical protein RV18_GL002459 [Enterococcus termitis]
MQRATLDTSGAKGIIVSPDTQLSIDPPGLVANTTGAVNADSKYLTALSYITLRQYNSAATQYEYTANQIDVHCDVVVGLFGQYPFKLEVKGKIAIDKSTLQYGKDEWNNKYSFEGLEFDVIDKNNKVVDTLKLDRDGKATSKDLLVGTYTLKEKSGKWAATGQTQHEDIQVTVEAGKTVTLDVKNTAVTGKITIKKSGEFSGTDLWNDRYSLAGNVFILTSKTDGKTYEITTNEKGVASKERLPLGDYIIEEKTSSPGFVNTFGKKEVSLTYQDKETEIVFGETSGTNREVTGENTLQKVDVDTEKSPNGKANMKTAKYQLFYADDSTGSSAHKKGDPVKWTDVPTPKLLKGEKVKEAIIGGNKVNFGDSVVIDIDDEALQAAIGNLSLGKYEWLEVDAGAGYVTDPTRHVFEIKKKDDKTAVVIAEEKTSLEQIINVLLRLDKSLTLPENQGGSGFNGVEFTAFPINGTVAEPVVLKTGINPTSGEDGYAEAKLVFGDWKLQETDGVAGYDNVRDIYIRMTVDEATDKLLIIASFNEDFSDPFNKREFTLSDSSSEKNPNAEGTAGNLDSTNFVASLSTIRFNDNPEKPKEPGIDVEKSNVEIPGAGQGNKQDKPNNVENDADDKETPVIVTPSEPTDIFFKITNTGNEDLTNIQPVDKTTEGSISIEKIKWEFSLDEKGFVLGENGQVLVLKPGESFTGKGTLPALPEGELHGNLITVTATGKTSEKQVEDEDPWYGIDEPEEPGIDIEKGTSSELEAGQGNKQDKPNNVDKDFDDKEAPFAVTSGKPTDIFFKITNTGKEPLSNIKPVDKTTDGSISINEITWDFKLNKEGFIVDEKDELLVLKPGESFTGKGVLPALPKGELHGNLITVEATGTESKKPVTDEDPFYALDPEPKGPGIDVEKASGAAPEAGKGNKEDKPNNVNNDFDDKDKPANVETDKETDIYFRITNTGGEPLTEIKPVDKTTAGSISIKEITWDFAMNDKGIILGKDGKPLVLQPGETFIGKGILPKLPVGELHSDTITVEAVGTESKTSVIDEDTWHGLVPTPELIPSNPATYLPAMGALLSHYPMIAGVILILLVTATYLILQRRTRVSTMTQQTTEYYIEK